jgi:prophage regulatory protein
LQRNIIRRPEVRKRTGLSDTQRWRLEQLGKFPNRIQISPMAVGWYEDEVDRWVHARVRAGGRQPPLPRSRRTTAVNVAETAPAEFSPNLRARARQADAQATRPAIAPAAPIIRARGRPRESGSRR